MLEKIRIIFTIPELRQKILLTLGLLAIYRVGWQVPLPIVDPKAMTAFAEEAGGIGDLLKTVAVFSASQLSQATIFGLGIMPYISASIIFQLLGTVWPPLERLQRLQPASRPTKARSDSPAQLSPQAVEKPGPTCRKTSDRQKPASSDGPWGAMPAVATFAALAAALRGAIAIRRPPRP